MLETLTTLINKSPVAHVLTDDQLRVQYVNKGFLDLCGYETEELIGNRLGPILHGAKTEPEVMEYVRALLPQRMIFAFCVTNYHRDGSEYRALVVVIPIHDHKNGKDYYLGVEKRVDQQRRAIEDSEFVAALRDVLPSSWEPNAWEPYTGMETPSAWRA